MSNKILHVHHITSLYDFNVTEIVIPYDICLHYEVSKLKPGDQIILDRKNYTIIGSCSLSPKHAITELLIQRLYLLPMRAYESYWEAHFRVDFEEANLLYLMLSETSSNLS